MDQKEKQKQLERAALEIRKQLLKLCTKEVIHIGGDLSLTDILTAVWQYKMTYRPHEPKWEGRDRFVLSKGHASAVTSLNQAAIGCFPYEEVINEYAKDGGRFSMHSCNMVNPFVDVSTGSLGHGFPIACGIAAGLRLKNNFTSRVYVVMGDAEQSEGSIWEAAMNAVKQKLGNVVAIIDHNGLGGDNWIADSTAIGDIAEKYRVFGWNVVEMNGNDMEEILISIDQLPPPNSEIPTVFVCHTTKGKGVPFMENDVKWHVGKITDEQYLQCVSILEDEFSGRWSK